MAFTAQCLGGVTAHPPTPIAIPSALTPLAAAATPAAAAAAAAGAAQAGAEQVGAGAAAGADRRQGSQPPTGTSPAQAPGRAGASPLGASPLESERSFSSFSASPQLLKVEEGLRDVKEKIGELEGLKRQLQRKLAAGEGDGGQHNSPSLPGDTLGAVQAELQQAQLEVDRLRAAVAGLGKDRASLAAKLQSAYDENEALGKGLVSASQAKIDAVQEGQRLQAEVHRLQAAAGAEGSGGSGQAASAHQAAIQKLEHALADAKDEVAEAEAKAVEAGAEEQVALAEAEEAAEQLQEALGRQALLQAAVEEARAEARAQSAEVAVGRARIVSLEERVAEAEARSKAMNSKSSEREAEEEATVKRLEARVQAEQRASQASAERFRMLVDQLGALLENPAQGTVAAIKGPRAVLGEGRLVRLDVACRNLIQMDEMSLSDPLVAVFIKQADAPDAHFALVGQTEFKIDDHNPSFATPVVFPLDVAAAASGSDGRVLRLTVYDVDSVDVLQTMGQADMRVQDVAQGLQRGGAAGGGVLALDIKAPVEAEGAEQLEDRLRRAGSRVEVRVTAQQEQPAAAAQEEGQGEEASGGRQAGGLLAVQAARLGGVTAQLAAELGRRGVEAGALLAAVRKDGEALREARDGKRQEEAAAKQALARQAATQEEARRQTEQRLRQEAQEEREQLRRAAAEEAARLEAAAAEARKQAAAAAAEAEAVRMAQNAGEDKWRSQLEQRGVEMERADAAAKQKIVQLQDELRVAGDDLASSREEVQRLLADKEALGREKEELQRAREEADAAVGEEAQAVAEAKLAAKLQEAELRQAVEKERARLQLAAGEALQAAAKAQATAHAPAAQSQTVVNQELTLLLNTLETVAQQYKAMESGSAAATAEEAESDAEEQAQGEQQQTDKAPRPSYQGPAPKDLEIRIAAGTNLVAMDLNGLSDPYVLVTLLDEAGMPLQPKADKTPTIKKSLNPVWNSSFSYLDASSAAQRCSKVRFRVMDWDRLKDDDFMGEAHLQLADVGAKYALQPDAASLKFDLELMPRPDKNDSVRGHITVEVGWTKLAAMAHDRKHDPQALSTCRLRVRFKAQGYAPPPCAVLQLDTPLAPEDDQHAVETGQGDWLELDSAEIKSDAAFTPLRTHLQGHFSQDKRLLRICLLKQAANNGGGGGGGGEGGFAGAELLGYAVTTLAQVLSSTAGGATFLSLPLTHLDKTLAAKLRSDSAGIEVQGSLAALLVPRSPGQPQPAANQAQISQLRKALEEAQAKLAGASLAPPATEKTEKEGGTDVEKRLAHLEEYGKAKQHQVMELQLELREKDQLQHMYTALSNQLLAEQDQRAKEKAEAAKQIQLLKAKAKLNGKRVGTKRATGFDMSGVDIEKEKELASMQLEIISLKKKLAALPAQKGRAQGSSPVKAEQQVAAPAESSVDRAKAERKARMQKKNFAGRRAAMKKKKAMQSVMAVHDHDGWAPDLLPEEKKAQEDLLYDHDSSTDEGQQGQGQRLGALAQVQTAAHAQAVTSSVSVPVFQSVAVVEEGAQIDDIIRPTRQRSLAQSKSVPKSEEKGPAALSLKELMSKVEKIEEKEEAPVTPVKPIAASKGKTDTSKRVSWFGFKVFNAPKSTSGVRIECAEDGPATACGMKDNDIITSMHGESVVDKKGFVTMVKTKKRLPGEKVKFGVLRKRVGVAVATEFTLTIGWHGMPSLKVAHTSEEKKQESSPAQKSPPPKPLKLTEFKFFLRLENVVKQGRFGKPSSLMKVSVKDSSTLDKFVTSGRTAPVKNEVNPSFETEPISVHVSSMELVTTEIKFSLLEYNEKGDPENDPELGYVIVPLQEVMVSEGSDLPLELLSTNSKLAAKMKKKKTTLIVSTEVNEGAS